MVFLVRGAGYRVRRRSAGELDPEPDWLEHHMRTIDSGFINFASQRQTRPKVVVTVVAPFREGESTAFDGDAEPLKE
jgi:hypothetical protein